MKDSINETKGIVDNYGQETVPISCDLITKYSIHKQNIYHSTLHFFLRRKRKLCLTFVRREIVYLLT